MGQFRDQFGTDHFGDYFGDYLGDYFGDFFGTIMGPLWDHFGTILGLSGTFSEPNTGGCPCVLCPPCVRHKFYISLAQRISPEIMDGF